MPTSSPFETLDETYRATFHFIHAYDKREPIDPFLPLMVSMIPWTPGGDPRQTDDPATWDDWIKSIKAARNAGVAEAPLSLVGPKRHAGTRMPSVDQACDGVSVTEPSMNLYPRLWEDLGRCRDVVISHWRRPRSYAL